MNNTPLDDAITNNCTEIIKYLRSQGGFTKQDILNKLTEYN